MGKQINFYMSEAVQESFIDYLVQNNFLFLKNDGNKISLADSNSSNRLLLYKCEFGKLIMREDGDGIDLLDSPIIELKKTKIKDKKILGGRLWVSTLYYTNQKEKLQQAKLYINEYQKLNRWIKKNIPYQEIRIGDYLVKEYANDEFIDLEKQGYIFTT